MSSLPARMMLIKSKMKELECSQDFSHYKSMGIFTDAQGQLTPQSLVRDVMDVLVTCKYEEDPIKNEDTRVDTTICSNFSDAQGQITLVLVSISGGNLNSSKLSRMSSLPARMRMIDSKMKELEWSQDFSHYKSMGIFQDAQGQLTPQALVRSGRILNSSEILWMFSLPASMKKIRSKMMALECSQDFSHYKSMGIFTDAQGQLTPQSLVRDVMDVLVTCKYEEDPIKNEGARVDTTLYSNFSDAQGQITLVLVSISGGNLISSKLSCMSSLPARMRMIDSKMKELEWSQDFSHYKSMGIFQDAQGQLTPQSLVRSGRISNSSEILWMFSLPASMKKIRSKMKALECSQDFSHYKSMGIFTDAQGQLTPQSLVRDVMDVLVTCKYEEDPIKNEGARVDTTLYSNFSDALGQITLVLVSVSGGNLNSSKLSCMSSLPARMRMIDSKMKELEWSQDFSHYKSMGIFQDAQGQLTPQSLVRSGRISNSS